jgi:predicted metal-dependent peptidase
MPAELERLLEQVFEPVMPWRDILYRFMTERAPDDYSWNKGNRRFLAQGLYLPSRDDIATGEIVVCVDTSGSIGEKELQEFGNEIDGIHKELKPTKTIVIYCDANVNKVVEFLPDDEVKLEAVGGGGTDFRPPFKWLEKQGKVPKCLVYLTDGYGPFPEEEPEFPNLWCITNHDITPPIGEHLILEVN